MKRLPTLITLLLLSVNSYAFQVRRAFSTYPVGTILQSQTAPADGGTWLACDGSSVSQSTYATLYGVIGHGYMNYTITKGTTAVTNSAANQDVNWTGTYWVSGNGTALSYSSDGINWTDVSGLSTAIHTTSYPAATKALYYKTAATAANLSSDGGASWSANTLPVNPTEYNIAPGNSTTNFLYATDSSRSIRTLANGTTTWATTTNALPTGVSTLGAIWWDGTNWNVIDSGASHLYQTSVAAGTSGWVSVSTTSINSMLGSNARQAIINHAPAIVVGPVNFSSFVSPDSWVTVTQYPQQYAGVGTAGIVATWNGYAYIALMAATIGSDSSKAMFTSKDGIAWHPTSNTFLYEGGNNALPTPTTNGPCDSSGRFIDFSFRGGSYYPVLYTPTPNTSTQFSLPNIQGAYIRAL